ncbi:T9SS type A sorting domain-containing protein [Bacteroidota bacterium]
MDLPRIVSVYISIVFLLIWVIVPKGSVQGQNILDGSGGGIIAFASDRDGQKEIYFMNADGSSQTRITNTAFNEYGPTWSPDCSKLAYRADGGIYYFDILDLSTGLVGSPQLVIQIGGASHEWTPDGWIIFDSPETGNWDIYMVKTNGDSLINITASAENAFGPNVSPDGTKIVFVKGPRLWVMNIDGTNPQQLTDGPMDFAPVWSPDGSHIAFTSGTGLNLDIAIINSNGTNKQWVTNSPWLDEFPSWSPDGMKITYECDLNNLEKVFTVDIEGTSPIQLTNTEFNDGVPDWMPCMLPSSMKENWENSLFNRIQLFQNIPNPFNMVTTISYKLFNSEHIVLVLYDILGKQICIIENGKKSVGQYCVKFKRNNLRSGIYYYQIRGRNIVQTKKMIIL